jgi:hypothetical protein
MKNQFTRYFAHALVACGVAVLCSQSTAQGQTLTASALPNAASGTAHAGASFTVQVTNDGPDEAFGVVVRFIDPKGLAMTEPGGNCMVLSKSSGATQCMLGYIAPGSSVDLDVTVSAKKSGDYSLVFSVVCTAVACNANQLTVPITLN